MLLFAETTRVDVVWRELTKSLVGEQAQPASHGYDADSLSLSGCDEESPPATTRGFSDAAGLVPISIVYDSYLVSTIPVSDCPRDKVLACSDFLAVKGGRQTFEIIDGVRRSKAADLVGNQTISAQVLNAEGKVVGTQNIPINQLLSPKPSIYVSTTVNMNRFMDTLNKTKAGSVPPSITVTPGGRGVLIRDVPLDPLGPN